MSFVAGWSGLIGSAETAAMTPSVTALLTARSVLANLVSVYGLVKQYEYQKKQLELARTAGDHAQSYLDLAQGHYNTIAMPTFTRMTALLDRFDSNFSGYYSQYLAEAFRQKEYTPDYEVQQGRAMATVQAKMDRAALTRRRATGRYATGRRCANATQDAILAAQARVDACRAGYQFEDLRKRKMDTWLFSKWADGSHALADIGAHAVSGINGGVSIAASALDGAGKATETTSHSLDAQLAALGNVGDFWGGIAQGGFNLAGASSFRGPQAQATTSGWGTVTSPYFDMAGSAKDAGGGGGFDQWDRLVGQARSTHISSGYSPMALAGT